MIHTGDTVQTYSYGRPYRKAEVLSVSMGKAEVKIIEGVGRGEVTWVDCDFLDVIKKAD